MAKDDPFGIIILNMWGLDLVFTRVKDIIYVFDLYLF